MAQQKNVLFSCLKISCVERLLAVASTAAIASVAAPVLGQCELQTVWSPNGGADHIFGGAVAGSASMDDLVISEDGYENYSGAVYMYRRAAEAWELEAMLVAPDGPSPFSQFGHDVAMAGDGKTALVAEIFDSNNGLFDVGAVWVFVENGGRWQMQQKLTASDAQDGWVLGEKVALSADGNVAVASAPGAPGDPVYVFVRNGDSWTEAGKLEGDMNLGTPWVDTTANGDVIVVGTTSDQDLGQSAGATYVFVRDGDAGRWRFRQKILASDGEAGDNFGRGVSISGNGDTILVGANGDDDLGLSTGAAYIFDRRGDLWFEQVKIFASDPGSQDHFGGWTTITPDGQRAIITATNGSAYVFDYRGGKWIETKRLRPSDPDVFSFSRSPTIADDGSIAMIGGPGSHVDGVSWFGAAVIFDVNAPLGDLDCDGAITAVDLLALLSSWGSCGDCIFLSGCPADLDLDCIVGASDLLILLSNWG